MSKLDQHSLYTSCTCRTWVFATLLLGYLTNSEQQKNSKYQLNFNDFSWEAEVLAEKWDSSIYVYLNSGLLKQIASCITPGGTGKW